MLVMGQTSCLAGVPGKGIKDDIFNDFSRSSYRIKVDGDTSKRLSIEEEPIVQV